MAWILVVITLGGWPAGATSNANLPTYPTITYAQPTYTSQMLCWQAMAKINNSPIAKANPGQIEAFCTEVQ